MRNSFPVSSVDWHQVVGGEGGGGGDCACFFISLQTWVFHKGGGLSPSREKREPLRVSSNLSVF